MTETSIEKDDEEAWCAPNVCVCGQDIQGHNQSLHSKIFPGGIVRDGEEQVASMTDLLELSKISVQRGGLRYPPFVPKVEVVARTLKRRWWQSRGRKIFYVEFVLDTTFPCRVPEVRPGVVTSTYGPCSDYVTAREMAGKLYALHSNLYNTYAPSM